MDLLPTQCSGKGPVGPVFSPFPVIAICILDQFLSLAGHSPAISPYKLIQPAAQVVPFTVDIRRYWTLSTLHPLLGIRPYWAHPPVPTATLHPLLGIRSGWTPPVIVTYRYLRIRPC